MFERLENPATEEIKILLVPVTGIASNREYFFANDLFNFGQAIVKNKNPATSDRHAPPAC